MSGGGGSTTTVQKSDPWEPTQPFLERAMSDAAALYRQGKFQADPYQGQRVAGFNQEQMQGQEQMLRAADAARGIVGDVTDRYGNFLGGAGDWVSEISPSGAVRTVGDQGSVRDVTTGGQMNLDAVAQGALRDVIPAVNSSFANSGMTGSDLHADTLGRSAANAVAERMFAANEAMQNRQLQAQGMNQSADAQNAGFGFQRAGMNQAADAQNIGFGLQAGAANQGAQAQNYQNALAAFGLAPQILGIQGVPAQMTAGVGDAIQAQRQRDIAASMEKYYEAQGAPLQALQNYSNLLLGYGGQGNVASGSQSGGGPSRGMSALGGAASGAAMGTMIMPGWGTAIGAGAGGLLGLLA